jgi:hypothetical protein
VIPNANQSGQTNAPSNTNQNNRSVSQARNPLESIEALQAHLWDAADNLRAARDLLLPRLMSGEIVV